MSLSRRSLLAAGAAAVAAKGASLDVAAVAVPQGGSASPHVGAAVSDRLYAQTPAPVPQSGTSLKPPFRLSPDWYRATVKRLQEKLRDRDLDGILVSEENNQIYLSGLFERKTERPVWLFVPAKGEPSVFYPGLDRDLIAAWWIQDAEWYFDYPHSGEYNRVVWRRGPRADLREWMLKGLAKRGFGSSSLGLDQEPSATDLKKMQAVLPEAKFVPQAELVLSMRQVKTPEEIELTQKSIDLHDAMLQFARNFILQHGTSITDFEVSHSTERFGTEMLMKALKVDGRPHTGVGIHIGVSCRTGIATAYPHPNQFFYSRIRKGDAIQVSGGNRIGGYGGEGYRAMQIEPMDDLRKKMWEAHTEMTLLQAELCKAGAACNEIGEKVLAVAQKAGLGKYVYHRPAHGAGMEGHQAPYLSSGDDTKLVENMMFSNEPGLYSPEGGYGYNHSNNVLVARERGVIMNKTPLTKEFCWLRL